MTDIDQPLVCRPSQSTNDFASISLECYVFFKDQKHISTHCHSLSMLLRSLTLN